MDVKEKAVDYAKRLGAEHGKNAVGWWDQYHLGGGRDTRPRADVVREAERLLDGINEGDPVVLDSIPSPDLSGQQADSLTGPTLVDDARYAAGLQHDERHDLFAESVRLDCATCTFVDDVFTDVCEAYEVAFGRAVEAEVVRLAKAALR